MRTDDLCTTQPRTAMTPGVYASALTGFQLPDYLRQRESAGA